MSSSTGNGDAGSDPNNVYPSLLSSNNFNPYTVSPYAPITADAGGDNRNPEVDTIRAYSNPTIEVLANMNIASPYIFSVNGQQIRPNQIQEGITKASVSGNGSVADAEFVLQMQATDILVISSQEATFQNEDTGQAFTLNVKGLIETQTLAVGTPTVDSGYVVKVVGDVLVNGTITSSGTFDISGLQVETLGVKNLFDVSGQSDLYGLVTAGNGINVTGNSYVLGRVGIQKTNPTEALDVQGNIRVSNNLDVSGNAQITGNTYVQGNLDVSGTINLEDVNIIDAKVTNVLTVLGRIDTSGLNINYPFPVGFPSNNMVMEINGMSTFYNDVTIDGGQLNVNATLTGDLTSRIRPILLINQNFAADTTANLEVNGLSNFVGSVYVRNDIDLSGTIRSVNGYIKNQLDVLGQVSVSGEYIRNKLDVSGQIDTSGLYVKNNLDVSGNLTVGGTTTFGNARFLNQYVQNKLDVSGQIDTSGLYVKNNLDVSGNLTVGGITTFGNAQFLNQYVINKLDVSGQIDTSGLYVKNNLDLSGNLTVGGITTFGNAQFLNQYVINKLDVSGQIDTSGLYVYNNLDVSGNLSVTGTTTFGSAQFLNQYIQDKLDVSGQIDTSGLYVYNNLDVSGNLSVTGTTTFGNAQFLNQYIQDKLDVSGQIDTSGLYVYNNLDVSGNLSVTGTTTFGNAQFLNQYIQDKLDVSGQIDTSGLYVYNRLDVSGQIDTSGLYVYNRLDVSGQIDTSGLYVYNNLDVSGNTNIQGTTNYRIQVFNIDSTVTTITDISNQPTMYVVDCNGGSLTVDLTTVSFVSSPLKVGVIYYFIARNTSPGTLQITYKSLGGNVTSGGIQAPLLTTLVCVDYDGTDNFFSAST